LEIDNPIWFFFRLYTPWLKLILKFDIFSMKKLLNNIKRLRQNQGWGQSEMATKLGISIPAFSKIESGITDMTMSRLEQIAEIFQVAPIELLSEDRQSMNRISYEQQTGTCKICEAKTDMVFNINSILTSICMDCASSIFIQQANWFTRHIQLK